MKIIISSILFLSTQAFAFPTSPVNWGGDPGMDACGGMGLTMAETVMITVNQNGGVSFDTVVPAGTRVSFCDYDSGYYGVLIHEEKSECGGGSATVPVAEPYSGPCKSGWIKEIFLELLAG